jgi:hypothetical protein
MKFKQSEVQNQRIERITTSHLVVGIDMAKETHVAQATNFRGIVLSNRHLSFSNSIEGFEKLNRWIEGIQHKHRLTSVIIGMEPTGHYWWNLANWLTNKGANVVLVNPATTKRNKENRDNSPSKSDPKDALVIAGIVSRGYYYETSGKRKGQIVISKRGDSTLSKYLFLATLQLIGVNPVFRELHEYNVKVKHMKKLRSVFKLLGKVARILISIVQKGETFTPEKASNIIAQAA